ncbi:hypothetical protein [Xanthomonas indica]|uniref:Restriction endonuclease n=1 Tax=Xanthomonas indica TaxID=2912242 RepID=A0AAU8I409_9XANT|nr:hypothetical protein [Xanthomonas indica]MCI2263389.1 hypothetical protein [Xanthomonas indica]
MNSSQSITPKKILEDVKANFFGGQRRKFLPGLLIALIRFLRNLKATGGKYASLEEFHKDFPLVTVTSKGGGVNTFTVLVNGKSSAIRKEYDKIADFFRNEKHRYDFPSSAPHATQAWRDYISWIEAILSFDDPSLDALEKDVIDYVLDSLPSQAIDPSTVKREPPLFLLYLQNFDLTSKAGEPTGAAYQGTVFGYIRADAPHLQVEVGKVRTGSKREKRVGDIDARDGEKLVLSAEVKQYVVGDKDLGEFGEFSQLIAQHQALGLVVALGFKDDASKKIAEMGLEPLSRDDLIERVRIWDPLKQRIAISAIMYYANFREQNSVLYERIQNFIAEAEVANTAKLAIESISPKEIEVDDQEYPDSGTGEGAKLT